MNQTTVFTQFRLKQWICFILATTMILSVPLQASALPENTPATQEQAGASLPEDGTPPLPGEEAANGDADAPGATTPPTGETAPPEEEATPGTTTPPPSDTTPPEGEATPGATTPPAGEAAPPAGEETPPAVEAIPKELPPEEPEEIAIATSEELKALADRVNGGDDMKNAVVTLTGNIDLKGITPWVPIGKHIDTPFKGVFNGGGYTVSGITTEQEGGLFGYLIEARVENLRLSKVNTPQSTKGLYFAAIRTDVADCALKSGWLGLLQSGISLFAYADEAPWDGQSDTSWYNGTHTVFAIENAKQLAGLADLVNDDNKTFSGKTVILTKDINLNGGSYIWTPIGNTSGKPFQGTFEGAGCTIGNLKSADATNKIGGGLFGYTRGGAIKNTILEDANISTSASAHLGAFAGQATGTSFSGCVLRNSTVSYDGASSSYFIAGIVGYTDRLDPDYYSITQCLVENSTIKGKVVAGIVGYGGRISALSQNVVYGGRLEAANSAGIAYRAAGPNSTYTSVSENLVLGATFGVSGVSVVVDGIMHDDSAGGSTTYNATTNNFISDIIIMTSSNVYLGTRNSGMKGIQSFFTDSPYAFPLIDKNASYAFNNYWDTSVSTQTYSGASASKIVGYTTAYLTSGLFNVNDGFWTAQKNYYPRLTSLYTSANPTISALSGLASVALLLPEGETKTQNAAGIILVDETPGGDAITWSYDEALEDEDGLISPASGVAQTGAALDGAGTPYGTVLTNIHNDVVHLQNITAEITVGGETYVKHFPDVTLRDTFLEEDIPARTPLGAATSTDSSPVVVSVADIADLKPKLTFIDPIMVNPNAGTARLERRSGGGWQTVSTVDCTKPTAPTATAGFTGFTFDADNKTVEFDFSIATGGISPFQPGQQYRVVIPAEAVKEKDKENYSQEIIIYLKVNNRSAVSITREAYTDRYLSSDSLTEAAIAAWFKVNGQSVSPGSGSFNAVPNTWISSSSTVAASIDSILDKIADPANGLIPATGVKAWYRADTGYNFTASSPAAFGSHGQHTLYIFAANSDGSVGYTTLPFSVQTLPVWDAAPVNHEHIKWSSDKQSVELWLAQKYSGTYTAGNGAAVRVAAQAEIPAANWSAVSAQIAGGAPFTVQANIWLPTLGGARHAQQTVTVAADNPAYLTVQSTRLSAYIPQTAASIEALILSVIREMENYTLGFTHLDGTADYDKEGTYRVQTTFIPDVANITTCTTAGCGHNQSSYNTQTQIFDIELIKYNPPTPDDFWVKAADDTRAANDYVKITRKDPPRDMPAWVMQVLQENPYNQVQIEKSGGYRWHFYGHAIQEIPQWRVYYPLDVTFEKNEAVTALLGSYRGVQFRFTGEGDLRADVGFDIKLSQESQAQWNLFRYDSATGKLLYVSDAILDGQWAQTVVNRIYDTTYVLSDMPYLRPVQTPAAPTAPVGPAVPEQEEPQPPPVTEEGEPEAETAETMRPVIPQEPEGGLPVLPLVIGGIGVLALAAILYVVNKRKKEGEGSK